MIIIFVGGSALSTVRLSGTQWVMSIVLGAISLPVAVLIRLIPNHFLREFIPNRPPRGLIIVSPQKLIPNGFLRELIPHIRDHNRAPRIEAYDKDEQFERSDAPKGIREQLKKTRGGRQKAPAFRLQGLRELLEISI